MHKPLMLVSLLGMLLLAHIPARAGAITLDAIRAGEAQRTIVQGGLFISWTYAYSSPLDVLEISSWPIYGWGGGTGIVGRGYLIYDLSSLTSAVDSARLEVDLSYSSAFNPALRVVGLDEAIAADLLAIPAGGASYYHSRFDSWPPSAAFLSAEANYDAIDYGDATYGRMGVTGPLSGVYNIDFNSAGIDAINAAGGLFALGLDWTPGFSYIGSDFLIFNAAPRLILDVSDSEVPSPGTIALLLVALGCLYARRRVITSAGLAR